MLNFPDTPTLNQLFASGAAVWRWDGAKWQAATTATPPVSSIVATGSITLPSSPSLTVNVANSASAPITLTMPAFPAANDTYRIKDAAGNAGTWPITIDPPGAVTIDGYPTYQIMSDYMSLELYWTGSFWATR